MYKEVREGYFFQVVRRAWGEGMALPLCVEGPFEDELWKVSPHGLAINHTAFGRRF